MIKEEEGDIQFLDDSGGGGYGKKNGLSYQEILMNQLSRITKIASQELREGYWKTLPMKSGTGAMIMTRIWIGDSRKEYINSVQCLNDLLLAQFDEEMKEKTREFDSQLKDKRKDYADKNYDENKYIDFELKIHRKLFQQLNLLIGRMGYFEEEEGWA